ncbi:hypothetical protein EYC84_008295 [Monilinia fructicola]|uniref:Uncharacterized protein n=1 Tax=Monilinia fructicola TaxID=38448 RepID=A0A5M9JGQ3_MONFR|nr:hypothetical protein EYC84_008295 [Monilinia fructicola]
MSALIPLSPYAPQRARVLSPSDRYSGGARGNAHHGPLRNSFDNGFSALGAGAMIPIPVFSARAGQGSLARGGGAARNYNDLSMNTHMVLPHQIRRGSVDISYHGISHAHPHALMDPRLRHAPQVQVVDPNAIFRDPWRGANIGVCTQEPYTCPCHECEVLRLPLAPLAVGCHHDGRGHGHAMDLHNHCCSGGGGGGGGGGPQTESSSSSGSSGSKEKGSSSGGGGGSPSKKRIRIPHQRHRHPRPDVRLSQILPRRPSEVRGFARQDDGEEEGRRDPPGRPRLPLLLHQRRTGAGVGVGARSRHAQRPGVLAGRQERHGEEPGAAEEAVRGQHREREHLDGHRGHGHDEQQGRRRAARVAEEVHQGVGLVGGAAVVCDVHPLCGGSSGDSHGLVGVVGVEEEGGWGGLEDYLRRGGGGCGVSLGLGLDWGGEEGTR